jgi:hypothetical protein
MTSTAAEKRKEKKRKEKMKLIIQSQDEVVSGQMGGNR